MFGCRSARDFGILCSPTRVHHVRNKKLERNLIALCAGNSKCCMARWLISKCPIEYSTGCRETTLSSSLIEDVVVREGEPLLYFRGKYRENRGRSSNGKERKVPREPRSRIRGRKGSGRRTIAIRGLLRKFRRRRGSRTTTLTWGIMRQIEHADECGFDVLTQ